MSDYPSPRMDEARVNLLAARKLILEELAQPHEQTAARKLSLARTKVEEALLWLESVS